MRFNTAQDRLIRALWFVMALLIRSITRVRRGRVLLFSYSFRRYSCHPKFISDYLIDKGSSLFDIYWAFNKDVNTDIIPESVKVVRRPSLSYLIALYSSQFVITNSRTKRFESFFIKKRGQKYIMTWHDSGIALKRVEKDVEKELGPLYVRDAKRDSKMCDLMLSASRFQTNLIRSSFWYSGEVLEKGVPRIDFFFNSQKPIDFTSLCNDLGLRQDVSYLLYAPTFRSHYDKDLSVYIHNWNSLLDSLSVRFNTPFCVLLRLHPNSVRNVDIDKLLTDSRVINVSNYNDIQVLLAFSKLLITDYSSCMFDMALLQKPCFLYAKDIEQYDRGFYFNIKDLPFPVAKSESELCSKIMSFNSDIYINDLKAFINSQIGYYPCGKATESVYSWMINHLDA